jgi:hypothetical protein
MERLLCSVGKQNGREGPNFDAGNNKKIQMAKQKPQPLIKSKIVYEYIFTILSHIQL